MKFRRTLIYNSNHARGHYCELHFINVNLEVINLKQTQNKIYKYTGSELVITSALSGGGKYTSYIRVGKYTRFLRGGKYTWSPALSGEVNIH